MEEIFQFWRRAFQEIAFSRDFEIRSHAAIDLRPPMALRLPDDLPVNGDGPIAFFTSGIEKTPAVSREGGRIVFHFDPQKSIDAMLSERHAAPGRPLASFCPFHYHRVPGSIRFAVGRLATMVSRPPFHLVADGVESIRRCVLLCLAREIPDMDDASFWPGGKKWAVALSHDVDSAEGSRNIPKFLEIERKHGFTSTWFFPAMHYPLDKKLLRDLLASGHEVGCHGYNHDGRLAHLDRPLITARIKRSAEILSEFQVEGFRSPAKGRSDTLFEELGKCFLYDSSVPDTDGASGCCTVFPYFVSGLASERVSELPARPLLEMPISVPMDADLLFHGFGPEEILSLWKKKLNWIKKMGGLAVIVTHPEDHFSGSRRMREAYGELLKHLASESGAWTATMREIAEWWRRPVGVTSPLPTAASPGTPSPPSPH